MAKGWESKSIESQVQDSETKSGGKQKKNLPPEQAEMYRRREVLLLARTRVQQDLESSQNPRYTELLNRALADVEAQLCALEETV
jgi:hypothetical protein